MDHLHGSSFPLVFIWWRELAHSLIDKIQLCLLMLQWKQVAETIYYYIYLQQYGKNFEVDLIGSETKINFFSLFIASIGV